jgi:hypothetical protein
LLSLASVGIMLWVIFRTPPMPEGWPAVRPGMSRLEVWQATHPGRPYRGEKLGGGIGDGQGSGGETQSRGYRALFWWGDWQMQVIYGNDGRAEQVATRYVGPFSNRGDSLGSSPRSEEDGWDVQLRGAAPAGK